ncbi:hypothetical protein EYB53_017235 [Candidatus Chloroploca sp. M-50]|uniref:Uncharacterized protein n=1 Tax=Candidatus Chloroploca mongolica TaxID=2528176 RepID=A0ABS4DDD7_9CHLR|nr:hypothetical protein [Candidatus Chloroploca mongolica]MBP1467461.1 hypothetical protein [Candidatus Chloroploca mongolica]
MLLGRLGAQRLDQQGRDWKSFPRIGSGTAIPRPDCRTFPETGFRVCRALLDYYTSHGLSLPGQPGLSFDESLALFGLPLSDERFERLSDGRT